MRIYDSLVTYFLACLLTNTDIISSREYRIKEKPIPNYLHYVNDNVEDDIFPNDISINTSMSRVTGTLLYSLDKNMNQLIVSLRDALPHMIDIELNKQQFSVSLSSLCGCERCGYEILELRIQLNTYINIQCNGGIIQRELKKNGKELNDAFPLWQSDINSKSPHPYTNTMCLVNTPLYNGIHPNPYQLSGCIFKVSYDERLITFTNVSSNIEPKCNKACSDNICNGGQCYETFSDTPICNCTATFLNGRFCNATIKKQNLQMIRTGKQIDMFKLSWKSSVVNIFELSNIHIRIILEYEKDDSSLYIVYNNTKINKKTIKVSLTDTYVPNTEYVCIVYFHNRNIDVRLLSNGSWYNTMIPLNGDLRKEIFDTIILRSGDDGYIDMAYKDEQEYKWRELYIDKYIDLTYDYPKADKTNSTGDPKGNKTNIAGDPKANKTNTAEGESKQGIYIVIAFFVVLSTALSIYIVYTRKYITDFLSIIFSYQCC